ncbi:MAG: DNA mismatch repair protein, partial [Bacteroidota bacterium]
GVIATHDLSLCQAEDSYPGQVHNQCFEVFTEGDQLDFDYQLRPGVCQRMNATFLMRQMGITAPQPNNNLA